MEPLERKERVCEDIPIQMLILIKIMEKNTSFGQQSVNIQNSFCNLPRQFFVLNVEFELGIDALSPGVLHSGFFVRDIFCIGRHALSEPLYGHHPTLKLQPHSKELLFHGQFCNKKKIRPEVVTPEDR
jgi:hypothetical protein